MSEQIDLERSPLFRSIAEGVGEAAEETYSRVMVEVRRELAPIYRRLDRLEANRRHRSRPSPRTAKLGVVRRPPSSPQPPGG